MNEDEGDLDELTDLRGQVATPESPPKPAVDLEELSPQDLRRLVHDLRVRQVELEMQNEELRQARRKLQASRDKYFDLYDLAPVGYLSVSQEGVILDANLTAAALLGVETGGLVARSLSHFVAQDDRDTFHTHHRQACEARTRQTCELKMSRGDGSQFHARLESMAVQRDVGLGNESIQSSGDLVCRVALSDVSEWVQAENALRETNTRLDALIEAIPDVIYFKDAQGRNLAVNRAYEKLLGLEKKDILGKTDEQLLPPILAEQCWKSDQEVIKARQLVRIEEQLAGEQGERIFFDTVKVPLLDEQGNVKGLVGISRDVTERVQVEEALRESEERYRTMIDAMDDLIHVVDRDLRLVLFNEACHKAFVEAGIAHDPTGLGIMEFCPFLSDEARLEYERVLKTGKPLLTEEATKVRGRTVWTETRKIPILDEAGKTQRVVTIVRDITEQVQASDMLGTYASQQAALLQLSASLAALLDEKDVCCEVVRELHDTLGYEHLGLYLVDEGAGERVLYANIGWPDPEPLLRILPGHGLSERPLLDSQLHYTPDVTRDPRYIPGLDEGGAEVDVPLRVGDKILGVLVIESHKPGAFDEPRPATAACSKACPWASTVARQGDKSSTPTRPWCKCRAFPTASPCWRPTCSTCT
jgi:PAS domain S-box-containing protein